MTATLVSSKGPLAVTVVSENATKWDSCAGNNSGSSLSISDSDIKDFVGINASWSNGLWGCVCFSNGSLRSHAVVFRCALASRCGLNCDCSRAVLSEACPSVSTCQPGINERFCIVHPTMLQKKASPSARKIRFMRKSWLVCRQGNTTKTLSDSMSRNSENRGPRSVDYFNGKGIALFDQRYQLDAFGNLAKAGVLTVEMSG